MRLRLLLASLILNAAMVIQCRAQSLQIHIAPAAAVHDNPISQNALEDISELLNAACHCLTQDPGDASVTIQIQAPIPGADTIRTTFDQGRNYPYTHYPAHDFHWQARNLIIPDHAESKTLTLIAQTSQGIANGLYALLQEKLGFKFMHPRQTILPDLKTWPEAAFRDWSGRPKFDKKGFHLHTMHPLELTEQLHHPGYPGGLDMIKEYIQWLARNGQNYFEFSLMEGVDKDLEGWAQYAAHFTQYAHDRGILCGLDLSIHMLQQKAFQLVQFAPHDFHKYEQQLHRRLEVLMHAQWDYINLEFALAEFVGGLEHLRNRLRDAAIAEMAHYPNTKLVGRQHVVKPEDEMGGSHGTQSLNVPSDPRMGVLVHTVMCYALTDSHAPVYELQNFKHLHELLIAQNELRETWFYPESAYWVTFDNSIPLLLLPYLNARYKDIETCAALGIPGHVTFSSGWEWGYWLVDWSIARWSWAYETKVNAPDNEANGSMISTNGIAGPYQYLLEFFPLPFEADQITAIADLQQQWLIEGNLLRWLCPSNPTDELPKPLNKQFQPRGFVNLGDLGKAARKMPESLKFLPIDSLTRFGQQCFESIAAVEKEILEVGTSNNLQKELLESLKMVAWRASHSAKLMEAVTTWQQKRFRRTVLENEIRKAVDIREQAMQIVRKRESHYRYPVAQLAVPYRSVTSYDFGYLYPVHNLHFWEREEQQILKGRQGPFFMNIYDLAKIAGLRN